MSYMTGEFPVTAGGADVGRVTVAQNGLLLVFDCTCIYRTHDIVRLAAVCHGSYVTLGVMTPVAEALHLKRSYSKNALISMGYENTALYHLIRPGDTYSECVPAAYPEEVQEGNAPEPEGEALPVLYNDFPDPVDYIYDYADDSALAAEKLANLKLEAASGWMAIANPGILFDDESIREACESVSNALVMEQDGFILLAVPILPAEPFPLMPVFCFGSSGEVDGQDYIIFKIKNGSLVL